MRHLPIKGAKLKQALALQNSASSLAPAAASITQLEFPDPNECRMWTNKLKEAVTNAKVKHKAYDDKKSAGN